MLAELQGTSFLFVSLVFFLIIISLLALGTIMSPVRWNERSKPAS
jgi:hypothetical protein